MELSIDTSTRFAGIALSKEGQPVAEQSWYSQQNHTVELTPAIQSLLHQAGKKPQDLTGIFVALGPGGFSALRVGLGVAEGLASGLNVPLVGVSTLEVEAYPYASMDLPIFSLVDAGRGQVAWAAFQQTGAGIWERFIDERVTDLDELVRFAFVESVLCGEALPQHLDALQASLPDVHFIASAPPTRRATTLARIGWERLRHGQRDDVSTLQPLYLRRPTISPPKTLNA